MAKSKKFDIRGVVFFSGPQQYIWYVEVLRKTYNEGGRTFYDAIKTIAPEIIAIIVMAC